MPTVLPRGTYVEPPTFEDELNRKTAEAIDWVCMRTQNEEMSPVERRVACQAIFAVASGLVKQELVQDITAIAADAAREVTTIRRVFGGEGQPKMFIVSWQVGSPKVVVTGQALVGDMRLRSQTYEKASAADAKRVFDALCLQMTTTYGLEEIG